MVKQRLLARYTNSMKFTRFGLLTFKNNNLFINKYKFQKNIKIREIVIRVHNTLPDSEYRYPLYIIKYDYFDYLKSLRLETFQKHLKKTILNCARDLVSFIIDESEKNDYSCWIYALSLNKKKIKIIHVI